MFLRHDMTSPETDSRQMKQVLFFIVPYILASANQEQLKFTATI